MLDYEEITISGPPIGVGGFGKVFRGSWRGSEVAVKVLRDQNPHIKELKQFKNEIEMVNKLRHKNIVNFLGAVTMPGKMCMVTEFIKLGSLQVRRMSFFSERGLYLLGGCGCGFITHMVEWSGM